MKPKTTKDISWLMRGYIPAAALGTALELGLFWMLEDNPMGVNEVAKNFKIPYQRCYYWLEYLMELGLLDKNPDGYTPSTTAQEAILNARSRETWAHLAGEARERLPVVQDMMIHLSDSGSVWDALGIAPPDYLAKLRDDPDNARRFTRMLYELHQGEAEELSKALDMTGVTKLMDIGGGSGVMSMALLKRYPDLEAVVVDQPNVCAAGRQIAREEGLEERITYHEANFLEDDLPTGFDMVIECDVGVYKTELFQKALGSLKPGGRFVILDYSFETEAVNRQNLMSWGLYISLEEAEFTFITADEIASMLLESGFQTVSKPRPLMEGLVIEAFK